MGLCKRKKRKKEKKKREVEKKNGCKKMSRALKTMGT
jgi:hypothetical protein